MEDKRQQCAFLRQQIDNRQGQIDLLEREIRDRKSDIAQLNNEVIDAKRKYKNIATEYGSSKVPIIGSKNAGRLFEALVFGTHQYRSPVGRDVEEALDRYNDVRFSSDKEIESLEREIDSIGRDINRLQKEKENLVQEMQYLGCFRR